jgi:hypothetical protein
MRFIIAAILVVLFFSHADAANEFRGTAIERLINDERVHVEKLNDADAATMDTATSPRPIPNSDIYLVTLGDSVIIALVVDGTIQISTNPIKLEIINKILNRTGA